MEANRRDALGNPLVIGNTYGFSNDRNGFLTVVVGKLKKHGKKTVTLEVLSRKTAIYNDELEDKTSDNERSVSVKWTKLFPIVD